MEELGKFLAACVFTAPLFFWIGGAIALLLIFFPLFKKRKGLALDLGYWKTKVVLRNRWSWVLPVLAAVTTILMATVLTDPQIKTKQTVSIYGKPVMVVVDVSGSMEYKGTAADAGLSTREKARMVFDDLLSRDMKVDFGLLLYSTENYIARYFAFRQELFTDTLHNDEEVAFIATGTRTAEALARARTFLLENVNAKDKAIILISDLEADAQAVLQMAEEMERDNLSGIKVYVILTGNDKRTLGKKEPPPSPIPGVTLVAMDDKLGIDQICAEIRGMEISPTSEEEVVVNKSLVPFLIPPILALITVSLVLSETVLRKIP